MDDSSELNEGAKKFNDDFEELKDGEVWAAQLKIDVAKFPTPAHARAFFLAIHQIISAMAGSLDLVVGQSTTGIGTTRLPQDDTAGKVDGIPIPKLDLTKYKN